MKKLILTACIILLLGVGVFFANDFILDYHNKNSNNKQNKDVSIQTLFASNKSLYEAYVIREVEQYLKDNPDIMDNKALLEIDTNKIIKKDNLPYSLQSCTGKAIINRENPVLGFKIESTCEDSRQNIYQMDSYLNVNLDIGVYSMMYPVSDGYIGVEEYQDLMPDGNKSNYYFTIIKYDTNGQLKWTSKYEDHGNSIITFYDIKEYDDGYLVYGYVYDIKEESRFFNKYTYGTILLIKYDKNGNIITEQLLPKYISEYNFQMDYIVTYQDNIYIYTGDYLFTIDKYGTEISKVRVPEEIEEENYYLASCDAKNCYLYNTDGPDIVAIDKTGKIAWKKKMPLYNEGDYIQMMYANDTYLFVHYVYSDKNDDAKEDIFVYDKMGNYIKSIGYGKLKYDGYNYVVVDKVNVEKNSITVMIELENGVQIDIINKNLSFIKRTVYDESAIYAILDDNVSSDFYFSNNHYFRYYYDDNNHMNYFYKFSN